MSAISPSANLSSCSPRKLTDNNVELNCTMGVIRDVFAVPAEVTILKNIMQTKAVMTSASKSTVSQALGASHEQA